MNRAKTAVLRIARNISSGILTNARDSMAMTQETIATIARHAVSISTELADTNQRLLTIPYGLAVESNTYTKHLLRPTALYLSNISREAVSKLVAHSKHLIILTSNNLPAINLKILGACTRSWPGRLDQLCKTTSRSTHEFDKETGNRTRICYVGHLKISSTSWRRR